MLAPSKNSSIYDLIVAGCGITGSATLYHSTQPDNINYSRPKILGIDQFNPPHSFGSSHGETRITRLAIGEGDIYVALARIALEKACDINVIELFSK